MRLSPAVIFFALFTTIFYRALPSPLLVLLLPSAISTAITFTAATIGLPTDQVTGLLKYKFSLGFYLFLHLRVDSVRCRKKRITKNKMRKKNKKQSERWNENEDEKYFVMARRDATTTKNVGNELKAKLLSCKQNSINGSWRRFLASAVIAVSPEAQG